MTVLPPRPSFLSFFSSAVWHKLDLPIMDEATFLEMITNIIVTFSSNILDAFTRMNIFTRWTIVTFVLILWLASFSTVSLALPLHHCLFAYVCLLLSTNDHMNIESRSFIMLNMILIHASAAAVAPPHRYRSTNQYTSVEEAAQANS